MLLESSSSDLRCIERITGPVSIYTPAGLDAWLAVVRSTRSNASSFVLPSALYAVALVQTSAQSSWVAEVDGQPIALAGLWSFEDRAEVWFQAGADTGRYMLPLAIAMRKVLHSAWAALDYPPMVVRVRVGYRPGERLATLLGFEKSGKKIAGKNLWEI